jgi:hypothetical protein
MRAPMVGSIVGPSRLQAAGIIKHAYMGALTLHAELLRSTYCEGHRFAAAGALCRLSSCALDDPHIAIAYNVVSGIRHDFLLMTWSD